MNHCLQLSPFKTECLNHKSVSLLSLPGKVYGRVVIEKLMACTEHEIGEQHCGFRNGGRCVNHLFAVKNLLENYVEK